MPAAALDAHLSACPDCATWYEAAARVTRLARVTPAEPIPDLTARILAAAGPTGQRRRPGHLVARLALAVLGLAQAGLAVPALALGADDLHPPLHVAHESGAWNLALAVAFLAAAVRPRYTAGLLPLLAAFVAVLAAASVPDIAAGEASGARLAAHLPAVVALLLVTVLAHPGRRPLLPPRRGRSTGWPAGADGDPVQAGWPSSSDGPADHPAAAEGRLSKGRLSEGRLSEGRLSEGHVA
jgi:predicted anti-sigma-YlaC factor YlaD